MKASERQSRAPGAIEAISVSGYKSLAKVQRVDLRPITLLAGANSSGKSSMMQPLLLLKQTLEAPYDPGALLLDGPNVRLTSARQAITKGQRRFSIKLDSPGIQLEVIYKRSAEETFEIEQMVIAPLDKATHTLSADMSHAELRRMLKREPLVQQAKYKVVRQRCFFEVAIERSDESPSHSNGSHQIAYVASNFYDSLPLIEFLQALIHLPGLRGNPQRTYPVTSIRSSFPGTFENYVAGVMHSWQAAGNEDKLDGVCKDLEHLGLTWRVEAKQFDGSRVELQVARLPRTKGTKAVDLVSIADVGLGVSQALPVVVALHAARPGQHVYLEQPELHLHPSAQWQMARVLASAAKRGVRVIVETHSSLIIRGLQTLVASGELPGDDVGLHWFTRDPKNGHTRIDATTLDKNGAFGEWPSDFDEISLNADRAYLDAVGQRNLS